LNLGFFKPFLDRGFPVRLLQERQPRRKRAEHYHVHHADVAQLARHLGAVDPDEVGGLVFQNLVDVVDVVGLLERYGEGRYLEAVDEGDAVRAQIVEVAERLQLLERDQEVRAAPGYHGRRDRLAEPHVGVDVAAALGHPVDLAHFDVEAAVEAGQRQEPARGQDALAADAAQKNIRNAVFFHLCLAGRYVDVARYLSADFLRDF